MDGMSKTETRLADLRPDQPLTIEREGGPPIFTTPRELMRVGRLSGNMSLDQVERAFTASDYERNGRGLH